MRHNCRINLSRGLLLGLILVLALSSPVAHLGAYSTTVVGVCEPLIPPNGAPPATKAFIRGDVNGDGLVDSVDLVALQSYISGDRDAALSFDAVDVNSDGKVDLSDYYHLADYLTGKGPPPAEPFSMPAVSSIYYCTTNPCHAVVDGKILRMDVRRIRSTTTSDIWRLTALDPANANRRIANARVRVDYAGRADYYDVAYARRNSPFGKVDFPTKVVGRLAKPITYHSQGGKMVRDKLNATTANSILADLVTVGPVTADHQASSRRLFLAGRPGSGNQKFPRCPDGCSGPVNLPHRTRPAEHACCSAHDDCYTRGGDVEDKKNCDNDLKKCLSEVPPVCNFWEYVPPTGPVLRPIGELFQNLFSGAAFRWHKEECTCQLDTQNDPQACAVRDQKGRPKDGAILEYCQQTGACTGMCRILWPSPDAESTSWLTSEYACSGPGPSPSPSASPTPLSRS